MPEWLFITGCIAAFCAAVALLVGGLVWGGSRIQKHYDRISCTQFGEQSDREVKFITYNYWAWDCLTPTADGKWISTTLLREFGSQP